MPFIIPANSAVSGGFNVANSLRFERASNDALNITPSNVSSRKTFTVSAWIKKVDLTSNTTTAIISARVDGSNNFDLSFEDDFQLRCKIEISDNNYFLRSTALYRDLSAWYHVVLAVDTTQSTDTNRVKLYVNGVILSSFATSTFPGQNADTSFNNTNLHQIGGTGGGGQTSMYLSEMVVIDGQALDPTSFGEFDEDSGIWKPIKVSGLTFGTNGFYLEFKQAGTGTNASGMGADTSGNNNHFAVANLTAVDQSTDTCTTNFCVMNVLDGSQWQTLSEGNLKIVNSSPASSFGLTKGSIGVTKGKWYWEVKYTFGSSAGHFGFFKVSDTAIANEEDINGNLFTVAGQGNGVFTGIAFRIDDGGNIKRVFNGNVADTNVDFSSGDILGLAFDGDSGKLYAFKNGTELTGQNISNGTSLMSAVTMNDIFLPFVSNGDGGSGTKTGTSEFNFGSPPYSESGGNSDGDGFGNFKTAPPSGYFALNTKNLAEYG